MPRTLTAGGSASRKRPGVGTQSCPPPLNFSAVVAPLCRLQYTQLLKTFVIRCRAHISVWASHIRLASLCSAVVSLQPNTTLFKDRFVNVHVGQHSWLCQLSDDITVTGAWSGAAVCWLIEDEFTRTAGGRRAGQWPRPTRRRSVQYGGVLDYMYQ